MLVYGSTFTAAGASEFKELCTGCAKIDFTSDLVLALCDLSIWVQLVNK